MITLFELEAHWVQPYWWLLPIAMLNTIFPLKGTVIKRTGTCVSLVRFVFWLGTREGCLACLLELFYSCKMNRFAIWEKRYLTGALNGFINA